MWLAWLAKIDHARALLAAAQALAVCKAAKTARKLAAAAAAAKCAAASAAAATAAAAERAAIVGGVVGGLVVAVAGAAVAAVAGHSVLHIAATAAFVALAHGDIDAHLTAATAHAATPAAVAGAQKVAQLAAQKSLRTARQALRITCILLSFALLLVPGTTAKTADDAVCSAYVHEYMVQRRESFKVLYEADMKRTFKSRLKKWRQRFRKLESFRRQRAPSGSLLQDRAIYDSVTNWVDDYLARGVNVKHAPLTAAIFGG